MIYYRESNGDYLCIDERSWRYYASIYPNRKGRQYEGRAAAIGGNASSVCTTAVSSEYISGHCKRVLKRDIPAEWLEMLV